MPTMKFTPNNRSTATNKQNGFVLVTSILFLVILTLIVLSMMRTGILEERMVGNSRDWNNAFQAAESGLRDAERDILQGSRISGLTGFVSDCSADGLCLPNVCPSGTDCSPVWVKLATTDTLWKSATGTNSKSVAYGAYTNAVALPGLPAQPRYIVEALTVPGGSDSIKVKPSGAASNTIYRITAVGYGLNTSSRVMLQSYVRPN